jgi:hypothetical protein
MDAINWEVINEILVEIGKALPNKWGMLLMAFSGAILFAFKIWLQRQIEKDAKRETEQIRERENAKNPQENQEISEIHDREKEKTEEVLTPIEGKQPRPPEPPTEI